jgi:hypothetical protein
MKYKLKVKSKKEIVFNCVNYNIKTLKHENKKARKTKNIETS